jgi:hypothetical protein
MNPVISREYVEKNYIHKDKLISKKQELEEIKEREGKGDIWAIANWGIELLNEILEETEDENNNTNNDSFKKEQSTNII